MIPLVSERVWQGLTGERSVHLTDWPSAKKFPKATKQTAAMDEVRKLSSVGNALRKKEGLRVRLPLQKLTVITPDAKSLGEFSSILSDELNVKEVEIAPLTDASAAEYGVTHRLSVNARAAGPRLGKEVQKAIVAAKNGDWSEQGGVVTAGGIELEPQEYELVLETTGRPEGEALAVVPGGGFVILDTTMTPELEAEGIARDAIRAVQEARKNAGLEVSDRIVLALNVETPYVKALESHADLIAAETLATDFAVKAADGLDAVIKQFTGTQTVAPKVFVSGSEMLGTEKAPLVITIDAMGESE